MGVNGAGVSPRKTADVEPDLGALAGVVSVGDVLAPVACVAGVASPAGALASVAGVVGAGARCAQALSKRSGSKMQRFMESFDARAVCWVLPSDGSRRV